MTQSQNHHGDDITKPKIEQNKNKTNVKHRKYIKNSQKLNFQKKIKDS